MRLRIVDISAALAAACALAVAVLLGESQGPMVQTLVAPNGTAVPVIRASSLDKGRSSKRAQPARARAPRATGRPRAQAAAEPSARGSRPSPRSQAPVSAASEQAEPPAP